MGSIYTQKAATNLITGTFIALLVFALTFPVASAPSDAARTLSGAIETVIRTIEATRGRQQLLGFYEPRRFHAAWCDGNAPSRQAQELIAALRDARSEGLHPQRYLVDELLELWRRGGTAAVARRDVLLTQAFMRFASHLHHGRPELRAADSHWHIEPDAFDPVSTLRSALAQEKVRTSLAALAPPHAGYRELRQSLRAYLDYATAGPWPEIPPAPTLLQEGDRGPAVARLRERLQREDYTEAGPADPELFDAGLTAAVQAFQRTHSLEVDGIVGPRTRAALNVSLARRIAQIERNMERWRWLPRTLGERHIMVNMAGFTLTAVAEGKPALRMRVIVGRRYRATPAFHENLTYLVVNPYWNVPPHLARADLLPRQQADPDYLQTHNIRILSGWNPDAEEIDPAEVDWDRLEGQRLPFRLRQDPGTDNALGRIKFMLPNRFSVYLHDTPARHLFERPIRTFSSGCIRLERPLELAQFTLGQADSPHIPRLQSLIEKGENLALRLPRPLPVYVVYWTAWRDPQDRTHFAHDIYDRDQRMADAHQAHTG